MAIDLRTTLFAPDSASSDIVNNVGIATSPFTGGVQITELIGAKWKLTFNYENLDMRYSRLLKAIKAQLRGGAEVAHIVDYSYIPRRSVELGTPVINGANQVGGAIAASGYPASTRIFEYGDQLSYLCSDGMYRMHVVTAAVDSDPSGNANIPILPPLRNPPVNGSAINSVNPCVSVALTSGGQIAIDGVIVSAQFEFTEQLYGVL
ncbi:distal tail protein [Acinetobacter phage Loki]|uniref:Putative distal tail protein n=1 Tax=Acinetobacter phage Loki TaxID=1970374 RepID=A0A0P1KKH7_9CAUD|nr:distal tail protein [Acinetobacter phage Loki]CUS06477.1 putative distal tail protein [Acinetobacter phage Loki]